MKHLYHVSCALLLLIPMSADGAEHDIQRVSIKLDNALTAQSPKVRDWVLSPELQFLLVDGKVASPIIHLKRGWTVPSWKGVVEKIELTHANGKLTGSLQAKIHSEKTVAGTFDIAIDATIADGAVSGTHVSSKTGQQARKGKLRGTIVPTTIAGDPTQDGVWTVHLVKALPRGEVLTLYLDRHDAKFTAFAFSPNFTRRPMDVDASGLTFEDSKIKGSITVDRLNKANDGTRSTFGKYKIDATIDGARVRGQFKGTTVDDQPAAGEVWGEIRHRQPIPKDATMWIKCEGGYTGGSMWQNRVFFQFKIKEGAFAEGTADNNKNVFKATLTDAKMALDGSTVSGTLKSTVLSSGSVTKGDYKFRVKGLRAGDVMYGQFHTQLSGKDVQTGYFVGGIRR